MNNQQTAFIPGLEALHNHMDGLIAITTANAYWKDKTGKYLGANNVMIQAIGGESSNIIIGATDYDLVCNEEAIHLAHNNNQVITNAQHHVFIESASTIKYGRTNYLSLKSPLLCSNGKIIGIFGLSFMLDGEADQCKIINDIYMAGGKYPADIANKYFLRKKQDQLKITNRQLDILTHLIRCKSFKQIADSLSLSPRTVENYINTLKDKLLCKSKSELIEKAFSFGLVSYY